MTGRPDTMSCCIVLLPPGEALADDLRASLEERRWRPLPLDDACLAMAELCLAERSRATRRTLGNEDEAASEIGLILVAPEWGGTGPTWAALRAAVLRHVPEASIWLFDGGELSALRGRASDHDRHRRAPDEEAPLPLGDEPPGPTTMSDPPHISRAEIEMLLREDPSEARTP